MTWNKTPPQVAGRYWWREKEGGRAYACDHPSQRANWIGGEWWSEPVIAPGEPGHSRGAADALAEAAKRTVTQPLEGGER